MSAQISLKKQEISKLMANIPGGFVIFEVCDEESLLLKPRYISEGFCKLLDLTLPQVFAIYGEDSMAGVHKEDYERVLRELKSSRAQGVTDGDVVYRLGNGRGQYVLVKNTYHLSMENGTPTLYSVYTDMTHELELQREIDSNSQLLKAIVNNIPGGVVKIVLQGDKIVPEFVSDSWCAMLGDSRENILKLYQNDAMAGVHPDDYARVWNVFLSAMQTGRPINSVYRVGNSQGQYRWVNNRSSLVSDENGAVAYYAIYTDVTEEMAVKQEYEKATKEMELIYNGIPGAVFKCRFDEDWTIIFANDGLFRFLGYTREEFKRLFDNKMSGVIYPEDGAIMVDKISRQLVYTNNVVNENRLICKDGSIKWISIHAQLMEDENKDKSFYCTFVDITEQKKAEAELSNTQKKLVAAIDHAGVAYWEYDLKKNKAYLNAVSTSEYALDDILENYPQSVYDSGAIHKESVADYQKLIDSVRAGEKSAVSDIKTVDKNGMIVWKRVRFTTLFDEHQKPFWAIATAENIDEYKRLEQQLSMAAAQTGVEVWTYDFANKTILRTATTDADYGISSVLRNVPESLVESGAVHPEDAQLVYDMYQKMRAGEPKVSCELRMFRADLHAYTYHKIHYTVIFDKNGKPERAIGTGVDISEEKKMRQRYEQESKLYEAFNDDQIICAVLMNVSTGKIEKWVKDTAFTKTSGHEADYMTAVNRISNTMNQKDRAEFLERLRIDALRKAANNGEPEVSCKYVRQTDNGKLAYLTTIVKFVKNPENGETMGVLTTKDITSAAIYEKAINGIVDNFYDFIVDVDVKTDTYTMLSKNSNLVNVPPLKGVFSESNEAYAKKLFDAQSTKDCIEKLSFSYMAAALEKQTTYSFNFKLDENGVTHTKKIQVFYIDKDTLHIGVNQVDVTELLNIERQKNEALSHALVTAERASKAKTEFLSRMSHDIRTPMNAIIGMTALTIQELDDKKKALENLQVIDSSSKLLLSMINDLLDMSRIESGNLTLAQEIFDCKAECQNMIELARVLFEQKQQTFEATKSFVHRYFVGDVVRLKRVVFNLLNNAGKFTKNGGTIRFKAAEEKTANPKIAMLTFEVSDNGVGIPEDKLSLIFQPFMQLESDSKIQGAGLGLSIVKSIVEAKGGTISVKSKVGEGSTFTVAIPLKIADQEDAPEISPSNNFAAQQIDFSGLHILLIEDHPVNTMVAKRLLEKFGATVDTAQNGQLGYERFCKSAEGDYNLIFMDIRMPVMDGYEATKLIRASHHPQAAAIPIIAMTANAYPEDIQKCLDCGMNEHIAKPISIEMIANAVKTVTSDPLAKKEPQNDEQ